MRKELLHHRNPNSFGYTSWRAEDTLDHHSWEVSEKWLRDNIWFWDKEVLEITNSWRARRGEPILTREDLAGS